MNAVAERVKPELKEMPVLPTVASPKMTERYVNIDSNQVISVMREFGFEVADVRRAGWNEKSSKTTANLYAKHMIDFRRPADFKLDKDVAPRVLFVNSHDGSAKAHFLAGLIRWVCSNGMVVGNIMHQDKVLHVGDNAKNLIDRIKEASKDTTKIFDEIERWRGIELDSAEIREFTRRAALLRFGDDGINRFPDLKVLAMPRRREDLGSDLWRVFNRLQENLTKGGLPGLTTNGHQLMTRRLTNLDTDLRINRELWNLTEEFATESEGD